MNSYIKFKATEQQLEALTSYVDVRREFKANKESHTTSNTVTVWGIFKKTEYAYTKPPEGIFWHSFGKGKKGLLTELWYSEFLDLFELIMSGNEVYLDGYSYSTLRRVLGESV